MPNGSFEKLEICLSEKDHKSWSLQKTKSHNQVPFEGSFKDEIGKSARKSHLGCLSCEMLDQAMFQNSFQTGMFYGVIFCLGSLSPGQLQSGFTDTLLRYFSGVFFLSHSIRLRQNQKWKRTWSLYWINSVHLHFSYFQIYFLDFS